VQVSDPIGAVSNTGNMILSRMPLQNAKSMVFKSTAGWQSIVSNGCLYATTMLPDGVLLHLFTTHLQCTTAPPTAPAADDVGTAQVLNLVEAGTESVRQRQLLELKAFMDRTICFEDDVWMLAGDLNIEGGSAEYYDMVDLFGRNALGAPDFISTYNTESFLTPPGWRGVEYSTALDHVLTNLCNITDFSVLADDIRWATRPPARDERSG
jgi:endonuclease/exonuclease/phosphatase family metal-dependent hydrolase